MVGQKAQNRLLNAAKEHYIETESLYGVTKDGVLLQRYQNRIKFIEQSL